MARISRVKALLTEYANIERLIRRGIVIPVSTLIFGSHRGYTLTDEESEFLKASFSGFGSDITLTASIIREEQLQAERLNGNIDLFFPGANYIPVFRELLHFAETKFTSKEVREPFHVGILTEVSSINAQAVSLDEIIRMREDEELFQEWRIFLEEVFRKLYLNKHRLH